MINYAPDGTCLIATAKDLCYLAVCVNAGFDCRGVTVKLTNDINLASVKFTPIGDDTNKFNGTFDGDVHIIRNLQINSSGDYVGLFGYVGNRGTIKNIHLTTVNISGENFVGGLAGSNSGTIANCASNGTVNGNDTVGGLVGNSNHSTLQDCTSNGAVNSKNYVGDFVGINNERVG